MIGNPVHAEIVHFKTADGWRLAASYREPAKGKPVALLIHGVASAKSEWTEFSEKLWKLGIGTLALDLRGHGESLSGPRGRRDFSDFDATGEWANTEADIAAALAFLKKRKFPDLRIAVIGASIGANLASRAAEREPLAWMILLSPGADYRGVALAGSVSVPALLGASPGDHYAYRTALGLMGPNPSAMFVEAKEGHGVQMFKDPIFLSKVLDWIAKRPSRR